MTKPALKILWLGRTLPFPPSSGDRAYTIGLLQSLLGEADITYVGMGDAHSKREADRVLPGVCWKPVFCDQRALPAALVSRRPLVSAQHSPPLVVAAVRAELLQSPYDCVVLDHYGLGWVLEDLSDELAASRCAVVYVAHNHEAVLAADTVEDFRGNPIKKLLLRWNARKIARTETLLTRRADLVTFISEDDARNLSEANAVRAAVIVRPIVKLSAMRAPSISKDTPRKLVMVGSFRWIPKQINLCRFLSEANAVATEQNARLDLIGDIPDALRDRLVAQYPWVNFRGFVDDLDEAINGYRLALNVEKTGGGFKLKNLTYVAAGLPIAALASSLTGVPEPMKKHMIVREKSADLLNAAMQALSDVDALNSMAKSAADAAASLFDECQNRDALLKSLRTTVADKATRSPQSSPVAGQNRLAAGRPPLSQPI